MRSTLWSTGRWALGAGVLLEHVLSLAPGVTAPASGEVATAVLRLGVLHPTGYPLYTMLAHGFARLVPVDVEPSVEVALFGAVCAAAAALLLAGATRELLVHLEGPRGTPRAADAGGLLAGFLLGSAPLLWETVRAPEVYPLHVLLVAAVFAAIARFETRRAPRALVAGALAVGLGLAHHVTIATVAGAALVYVALRAPRLLASRWALAAALALVLPLGCYAYLPWANAHTDAVPWGGIDGWGPLLAHVTAARYRGLLGLPLAELAGRAGDLPYWLESQFPFPAVVLCGVGAVALARRAGAFALFLACAGAASTAHALLYDVSDWIFYLLPAVAVGAVLFGAGLWQTARWLRGRPATSRSLAGLVALCAATFAGATWAYSRVAPRMPEPLLERALGLFVLPALGLAGVCAAFAWLASARALRGRALEAGFLVAVALGFLPLGGVRAFAMAAKPADASAVGAALVRDLPPGSVLLAHGDAAIFALWYQQHVKLRGLGLGVVALPLDELPWYRHYLATRQPRACDPLGPAWTDPERRRRCATFRGRLALPPQPSWIRLPDPAPGAEDDALPLAPVEVRAHALVAAHLGERRVFERDVWTSWRRVARRNLRGGIGPSFHRIDAAYALVNRGAANEIVTAAATAGDWCGPVRRRLAVSAPLAPARSYTPSPEPTRVRRSFLAPAEAPPREASQRRQFGPQAPIAWRGTWFEGFADDSAAPGEGGARPAVRVCVYGPDGGRVFRELLPAGDGGPPQEPAPFGLSLALGSRAPGAYLLQACRVGVPGRAPPGDAEARPCTRLLAELPFRVAAGAPPAAGR